MNTKHSFRMDLRSYSNVLHCLFGIIYEMSRSTSSYFHAVLSLSASKASSGQRWRKGPRPASTCHVDVVGELQLYDRPTLEHIPLQETIRLVRLSVNLHALKYELVL